LIITLTVSFLVLAISLVSLVHTIKNLPLEIKEVEVSFEVGGFMGIDLNNESLTFGVLVPGYSAERKIHFKNNYEFPVYIEPVFSKEVERFLSSGQIYFLGVDEELNIPITLRIPQEEEFGNHSGFIKFKIYEDKR